MLAILRALWEAWKRLGHRLANVQARLMLGLIYVVAVWPFALILRFTGRGTTRGGWSDIPTTASTVEEARRQY